MSHKQMITMSTAESTITAVFSVFYIMTFVADMQYDYTGFYPDLISIDTAFSSYRSHCLKKKKHYSGRTMVSFFLSKTCFIG